MMSVTDLTTYIFCPRKLYLQSILEFEEPPKEILLQGSIKHKVYDKVNKIEESLVTSILKPASEAEIQTLYRKKYSEILMDEIKSSEQIIEQLKLSKPDLFEQNWPLFLNEANLRANYIFEFIESNNIFGEELWKALTPKIMTEIKLISKELELIGVVDRIEIRNNKYVPIEIKTGNPPSQNVWPEHKVQIGAYGLLIEKSLNKNITHGFIHYIKTKEKRLVYINPFLKGDIIKLSKEVKELLSSNKLPPIIENKSKCKVCSLRDDCYKLKQ